MLEDDISDYTCWHVYVALKSVNSLQDNRMSLADWLMLPLVVICGQRLHVITSGQPGN